MRGHPVENPVDFWHKKPTDGSRGWSAYWDTMHAPHRTALVQTLRTLPPFSSLLEVGCGPGVNLWRILEAFPDAEVCGIDVSQGAIDSGSERFADADRRGALAGHARVTLCAGQIPEDLAALQTVDVVVSCYALAYVWPDRINETLARLQQLAHQAIVLAEPMVIPGFDSGPTVRRPAEFRYDYLAWFQQQEGWQVTSMKPVSVDRMNRILVAQRT